VLIPNKM